LTRANRGRSWEAQLDHQHRIYRQGRRAVIFRAHPATKVVAGRAIRQKGPPDYFGALSSGLGVLFDAKSHRGRRLPFGQLQLHQARDLEAWHIHGGLAGIALRLEPSKGERRTYWVGWGALGPPWWAWRERHPGARASIDLEWLADHGRDLDGGADWLRP